MTIIRSKDAKQGNESYLSNDTDSATKEEEQKLKATVQQSLIKAGDQLTLHVPSRESMDTLGSIEGTNGISTLGPSYHGPRDLLSNTRRPQEAELKVTHSTTTSHQCWVDIVDQHTLMTCARTSLNSFGDSKGRFGIFTLGSSYHGPRFLLSIIRRTQDQRMKVTQSALGAKQCRIDFTTSTPCEAWLQHII